MVVLLCMVIAMLGAAPPSAVVGDFRLETDQVNANLDDGNFLMPHQVKFFRPGTDVVGDSAKGNYKVGMVTIIGHVVLHDSGQGSSPQKGITNSVQAGLSTLTCDELQIDSKRKIYVATGKVVYVQASERATAERGRLDQVSHLLTLSGDVHLSDGEQMLATENFFYNTVTKDVSTAGAPVTLSRPASRSKVKTGSTLPTPASTTSSKPKW